MAERQPDYRTAGEVGKVFHLTAARVRQFVDDGILETVETPKGRRYDWDKTVEAYVKFLSDKAHGREQKKSTAELEEEKLRAEVEVKKAKAEAAKLELAELRGKMHKAEDVEAIMTDHVLYLRSMLIALPGKLAVDCANCRTAAEASERIQREVYYVLNNLAGYEYDPEEYKKRVRQRRGWADEQRVEHDDE